MSQSFVSHKTTASLKEKVTNYMNRRDFDQSMMTTKNEIFNQKLSQKEQPRTLVEEVYGFN